MAWFKETFTRRAIISVDNTAGAASADINVTIPKSLDAFWDVIDSSGLELRVVSANSETILSYAIDNGSGGAFDATAITNRNGRLQIDAASLPAVANSTVGLWLYWGTTSTQGTGASAVAIASAINGYIELSNPGQYRFAHHPQVPGQTRPRFTVHKRVAEEVALWVDYGSVLQRRPTPGNKGVYHEEIWYATPSVLNISAADQTAMYDATKNRLVWWNDRFWYKMIVKAGTTATNYTAIPSVRTLLPGGTALNQTINSTIGIHVRDTIHTS